MPSLTKQLMVGPLLVLSLGLALTACSSPLTAGIIVSKDFKEAHTIQETVCESSGYVTEPTFVLDPSTGTMKPGTQTVYKCFSYKQVPREIPASYSLVIEGKNEGDKDKRTNSFSVPQTTFDDAHVGYFYDNETGKVSAR